MTVERQDGILVDTDLQGRLSVGIESERLPGCLEDVRRMGAVGVFGSPAFGFREKNLDFFAELPDLRKVWFWDVNLDDVAGIYALEGLESFGVHPKRPAIDFAKLPHLEQIVWEYKARDRGIHGLQQLQMLHLWHFNPKRRAFEGLELPSSLTELQISWANPSSLAGIPELPNVRHLEIHRCRNLESIAELPRIAPNLEHLVVASCGRVADGPEVVKQLPKLKHAYVRDSLLVKAREGKVRDTRGSA